MATARLGVLAKPKSFAQGYKEDRRSVYWVDREPHKAGNDGITVFAVTPGLDQLSQPKRYNSYTINRLTAIWPVTMGAKNAESSARVQTLAEPKPLHHDYHQGRSAYTEVSPGAKSANPSSRIGQLSQPKPHKTWGSDADIEYRNTHYCKPVTEVSPTALKAICTPRVETLAAPKSLHSSFQGEKPVRWIVPDTAINASASARVQQLARPKTVGAAKDEYDPYRVTPAAKSAHASTRVAELATPIARKVRQKTV